jgi:hypothetical protein
VAAPPFEAIFEDDHGVGLSAPLADELGSGLEAGDATAPDIAVALQGLRQVSDTPPGRGAKTAIGLFLDLPADTQHEQVARHVFGRMGAIEPSPLGAQGGRIHLFECLELACDIVGNAGTVRAVGGAGGAHGCKCSHDRSVD